MRLSAVTAAAALAFALGGVAMPAAGLTEKSVSLISDNTCSRDCMTTIVDQILASMLLHNPGILPLAPTYYATENSHPAALGMMTLWRTVTSAGSPTLLAIDTINGSAYFALDITEGSQTKKSVLWARIKVVDRQITQLELYVNRSRGDHGFSFSAAELPKNFEQWMSPPADRQKATRAVLESLSAATFNPNDTLSVSIAEDCQFTEEGWSVIDPGPDEDGSTTPLGCSWRTDRPADADARLNLVIDEQYGIVVTGAIIPGKIYPYGEISAFIPNDMKTAQAEQDEWLAKKQAAGNMSLLAPTAATGETLQVLQFYNGELQGQQVMLYLSGPNMQSAWS